MFEVFAEYLKTKGFLTNDEIAQVRARTIVRKLRKRQYLLQEGDVSRYNSFVAKGCLRLYHVGDNGAEYVLRFAIEHWWTSDYESFHSGNPSKYNIEALEDSELLMIEKADFDALKEEIPNFRVFVEKLDERCYDVGQNRILSVISDSAEKRYEKFMAFYPDVFNRVPLHMIASYLGLTRETLSRIRGQYAKKEQ